MPGDFNMTACRVPDDRLTTSLKVGKSRKQILKFLFGPKNERKYLCTSALASKMGQIIRIIAHYHANT